MKFLLILINLYFVGALAAEKPFFNKYVNSKIEKYSEIFAEFMLDAYRSNTQCIKDLQLWVSDFHIGKPWALFMADAFGKIQPGYLQGNVYFAGSYDQCLEVCTNKNNHIIRGQYCTILISPTENSKSHFISKLVNPDELLKLWQFNFTTQIYQVIKMYSLFYGICIPESCTPKLLREGWNYANKKLELPLNIEFYDLLCDYSGKPVPNYDVDNYIFAFFITVIILVILSTFYDLYICGGNENTPVLWTIFSLNRGIKRMLLIKEEKQQLTCIHGMKVISILWIIMGHRFLANGFSANINPIAVFRWKDNVLSTIVTASGLAVDSFFTLGGILLIYNKLIYAETRKLSIITLYGFRMLRLLPSLVGVILFYISLVKYCGSGPIWQIISNKLSESCYYGGWKTFFQLSNFFDIQHQCVEQAWYLSLDTQLLLFSPIILFNINKYPMRTSFGIITLLLSSTFYTFYISYRYNYGTNLLDLSNNYLNNLYYPAFVRMPPWIIGLVGGYLVYQFKNQEFTINKSTLIIIWCSVLSTMTSIVVYHVILIRGEVTPLSGAFFNAFSKQIWAICLVWIVFACETKNGGVINEFLSLAIFKFLGKLTYSIFLVHLGIILILVGSQKSVSHFSMIQGFQDFLGDSIIAIFVGMIFWLTFEYPSLALLKVLDQRKEMIAKNKNNQQIVSGTSDLLVKSNSKLNHND